MQEENNYVFRQLFGGLGFAAMIVYAFRVKSGFWKGWGYAIIGGIGGMGIGYGIDLLVNKYSMGRDKKAAEVAELSNQMATTEQDRQMSNVFYQMNQQELNDSYQLLKSLQPGELEISDPALIERLKLISVKYNIFT